jgi:SAM-dependent methyltransferase
MNDKFDQISQGTIKRYSDRYSMLGYDVKTLGWGSLEQQRYRFFQTLAFQDIINGGEILDVGCGFGDYLDFLDEQKVAYSGYHGVDINSDLVHEAKIRHRDKKLARFSVMDILRGPAVTAPIADVGVMLGVLNFRLKGEVDNLAYTKIMLEKAFGFVRNALIVDFLSARRTVDYPEEDFVYYHDPHAVIEMAFSLSEDIILKHDYRPIPQRELMLVIKRSI